VIEEKIIRSPWAKFTRTSGTETVKANADFGEIKARFLVRYSPTLIDRKMVVKYNGDIYNIVYVNDYEDGHEYIEIWCDIVGLK
jgi:SPP1 family predicted phage head-tail adaptor